MTVSVSLRPADELIQSLLAHDPAAVLEALEAQQQQHQQQQAPQQQQGRQNELIKRLQT